MTDDKRTHDDRSAKSAWDEYMQDIQRLNLERHSIDDVKSLYLHLERITKDNKPKTAFEARAQTTLFRFLAILAARDMRASGNLKLAKAPGELMSSFASLVFSKPTRERVFDPIVADFRHEYCVELSDKAPRSRLFFVHVRHWSGFIAAVALQAISALAKVIGAYRSAGK